ncbi:hypothetical protein [Rhodoblastus sp.]
MACARLKAIVLLALVATAAPCGTALCWQGIHSHRPVQGYRNRLLHRDLLLLLPGQTINPNYSFPELPGAGLIAPEPAYPPYPSEPNTAPLIPHETPSLPQGMVITVYKNLSEKLEPEGKQSSSPVERPKQAAQQLATCWEPPVPARGDTVEVTLRFGFNKMGEVLWPPRVTYLKAGQGISADEVRKSILAAIKACTPLRFTNSMAANMPGYPLAVRFVGQRAEETGGRN